MDITTLTKLVSIILAISLASERLVTLIKTLIPALASPAAVAGAPTPTVVTNWEKWRQVIVMLIALVACWVSATLLNSGFHPFGDYKVTPDIGIPVWIIGVLASAGSAFWTSILGYTRAVKDISTQQSLQEKMKTNAQLNAQ
jgi:hypothetical protein